MALMTPRQQKFVASGGFNNYQKKKANKGFASVGTVAGIGASTLAGVPMVGVAANAGYKKSRLEGRGVGRSLATSAGYAVKNVGFGALGAGVGGAAGFGAVRAAPLLGAKLGAGVGALVGSTYGATKAFKKFRASRANLQSRMK